MVERKAERLLMRGVITSEEREAVRATNGHNDHITRDFYLLNSRKAEQRNARRFSQLLTGEEQDDEDEDLPELVSDEEDEDEEGNTDPFKYQRLWGTKHPDKRQGSNIRVEWTTSEIRYIRSFESKLRANAKRDGVDVDKVLKTLAARSMYLPFIRHNYPLTSATFVNH
jgi:hypothetical protein